MNKFVSKQIIKLSNFNTYLYLGVFALSLILLIFVLNKLYVVKNEVVETRKRVAKLDNDLTRLDTIVAERKENEEKFAKFYASLPSSYREVAYFTQKVEEIAKGQGESLEVTVDKTTKNEGSVDSLKFGIKTRGDYRSIKNTLSLLAYLPYHTTIDSLKMESDAGTLVTLTNFRLLMQKQ